MITTISVDAARIRGSGERHAYDTTCVRPLQPYSDRGGPIGEAFQCWAKRNAVHFIRALLASALLGAGVGGVPKCGGFAGW